MTPTCQGRGDLQHIICVSLVSSVPQPSIACSKTNMQQNSSCEVLPAATSCYQLLPAAPCPALSRTDNRSKQKYTTSAKIVRSSDLMGRLSELMRTWWRSSVPPSLLHSLLQYQRVFPRPSAVTQFHPLFELLVSKSHVQII